ncbi:MAG: integrase arm-type DNA-binding domain-containing protein [Methylococcaceae bacterium]|nr:integrase arm-type DNA-binding domain-containing protein [Methylococcaceae bacterium]
MASEKIEFTRASLTAIPPPDEGRVYVRDTGQSGLVLDITPKGTKIFQLYRKIGGRPIRCVLGRFDPDMADSRELPKTQNNGKPLDPLAYVGNTPHLNVRMARALAVAVSAALDRGENPGAEKREQRRREAEELTLRQAFDRYYIDHLQPQAKRTAEELQEDFARYLGTVTPGQKKPHGKERKKAPGSVDWESRRLSTIKPADVRKMMASLRDGVGPRTAKKAWCCCERSIAKLRSGACSMARTPPRAPPSTPKKSAAVSLRRESCPSSSKRFRPLPSISVTSSCWP